MLDRTVVKPAQIYKLHIPNAAVAVFGKQTLLCTASIKKPIYAPASLLGDHSVCDPPDPIPNSAVKPVCADGTIAQALEE